MACSGRLKLSESQTPVGARIDAPDTQRAQDLRVVAHQHVEGQRE